MSTETPDHPSLNEPKAASPPAMISVRAISKQFAQQKTLADLSFEIAHGEMLVILGPSGSGKTTLLRIIAGLELVFDNKQSAIYRTHRLQLLFDEAVLCSFYQRRRCPVQLGAIS